MSNLLIPFALLWTFGVLVWAEKQMAEYVILTQRQCALIALTLMPALAAVCLFIHLNWKQLTRHL